MFWTDGSIYRGMWHKGIQHGKGRMEFPDGTIKEGLFENNIFKGSIPNRLKLYQKTGWNSINYRSLDKIASSTAITFESNSKQNRASSNVESLKKKKKNNLNDSYIKINGCIFYKLEFF